MHREKEEIHAFSTETHTENMGKDNNSPPENVHNMVSEIFRQWIEKEKNTYTFNTNTHHSNMGQDNNSPPENVHNMVSGILR